MHNARAPWLRQFTNQVKTDEAPAAPTPVERKKELLMSLVRTFLPPEMFMAFGSTLKPLFRNMSAKNLEEVQSKLRGIVDELDAIDKSVQA